MGGKKNLADVICRIFIYDLFLGQNGSPNSVCVDVNLLGIFSIFFCN